MTALSRHPAVVAMRPAIHLSSYFALSNEFTVSDSLSLDCCFHQNLKKCFCWCEIRRWVALSSHFAHFSNCEHISTSNPWRWRVFLISKLILMRFIWVNLLEKTASWTLTTTKTTMGCWVLPQELNSQSWKQHLKLWQLHTIPTGTPPKKLS